MIQLPVEKQVEQVSVSSATHREDDPVDMRQSVLQLPTGLSMCVQKLVDYSTDPRK